MDCVKNDESKKSQSVVTREVLCSHYKLKIERRVSFRVNANVGFIVNPKAIRYTLLAFCIL